MTEDKLRTELEPLLADLREDLKRIDYGGIHVGHDRHILRRHIKKSADTIEGLLLRIESLTRIASAIIELEAPAEHLPEPMSSNLLSIIDEAREAISQ